MDQLTIEEFLTQIGPDFLKFADTFRRFQFCNVKALRCINIKEDLNTMFADDRNEVHLSLGEQRQLEQALNNLKDIQPDEKIKQCLKEESSSSNEEDIPSLMKIHESLEEKIKLKRKELKRLEQEKSDLEEPVAQPSPQGNLSHYCSRCHIRGHKTDGNKGGPCKNRRCKSYKRCGKKEKHPEYSKEPKDKKDQIKKVRKELDDLSSEKEQFGAFHEKQSQSFTTVMKERLKKTNPTLYTSASALMKDLLTLKCGYNSKIPTREQNDSVEFRKILKKTREKASLRKVSSCSESSEESAQENSPSPSPKAKKIKIMSSTSSTAPTIQQLIQLPIQQSPSGTFLNPYLCPVGFPNFMPPYMDQRSEIHPSEFLAPWQFMFNPYMQYPVPPPTPPRLNYRHDSIPATAAAPPVNIPMPSDSKLNALAEIATQITQEDDIDEEN